MFRSNLGHLKKLVEPIINSLGYELILLEFTLDSKCVSTVLRVYIDTPSGVWINDCEFVSRQLSAVLDIEDSIKNNYILEVSSPGVDRLLMKPKHFQQVVGNHVKIVMQHSLKGKCKFFGQLVEANETFAIINSDGKNYELLYNEIKLARLEPVF